jgi:fermentation-respiration switch protein FrsA (DUF1100 family)
MKIVKALGSIVGILLVLCAGFLIWVWVETRVPTNIEKVTAAPRGDTLLSEFYASPEAVADAPGVLIQQEEIEGEATLAEAGANLRILYSSTEGLGGADINAVSGAVFLPEGEAPEGGWPLLVWSHGTVGIGDVCAPSFAGRGERDRTYLGPWLEKGYAIAASDYQGLGTKGTHPYMDARTMAYNNLDLIRAVQGSDLPISDQVVIAGQSQGATGALATGSYANDYAPGLEIAGILATGVPHFSPGVIWELAANSDREAVTPSAALSLYMLALTEMIDPDFQMEQILSEKAKPVAAQMGELCAFDFIDASIEAGLSTGNSYDSRPEFALIKVFSRTALPDIDFDTPIFTGSGTSDIITPYPMQTAFIDEACKAGANLTSATYDGANHNEGLLRSIGDAQSFADTVLAGGEVKGTCSDR